MSEDVAGSIQKILDFSKENKAEIKNLHQQLIRLEKCKVKISLDGYSTTLPESNKPIIQRLLVDLLTEKQKIQEELDGKLKAIEYIMRG